MTKPLTIRTVLFEIAKAVLFLTALLAVLFTIDGFMMSRATPPESVRTLDDFMAWKKGGIMGKGTVQLGGVTYTVVLGGDARTLASGSAAYLFDANGQFVDWTGDMGDYRTIKYHFDLSGGVKDFERGKR